LLYNFQNGNPFSTFGEILFILVQNVIILFISTLYSQRPNLFLFGLGFLFYLPLDVLFSFVFFITIASKLPQIYSNFKNRSIGQLSLVTCFLQFAGSCARIFTTLQEVDDVYLVYSNMVAAFLNGVLFVQFMVYPNKSIERKKKK
jgi:hypothetical protein